MDKNRIILVSCGHFEKIVIDSIAEDIVREFHYPVFIKECSLDLSDYYNPGRRQYNANRILDMISSMTLPGSVKTIGLLRVDIFIPILTYIFGQAMLNGDTGIASLYRLRNELYGLGYNNRLLIERFRKVVIHEIGHTFGLIHCYNPSCVMRSSTYVEDIDQKKIFFCAKCRQQLDDFMIDDCRLPTAD